ncbi:MAG: DoxX family protein [Flammeovirgaceae bacterium]|nr:DoxX family protein [Flammeovirgaceae bacterium]
MSKALPSKPGDKKFLIIAYILGAFHLIFGGTKLIGQTDLTKEFTELWQFPLWFMYFVGVAQVLGGIALFTRQLRMPASLAMAFIMIGAIVTTIISGQAVNVIICTIVLVLCMLVFKHRVEQLAAELAAELSEKNTK